MKELLIFTETKHMKAMKTGNHETKKKKKKKEEEEED
jgi:hypothetical protein